MSICSSCGARNARENTVCRSCGAVLGLEAKPAAPSRDRWAVGPGEDASLDDRADAAISPAMDSGEHQVPLGRAALFGVVAAAILGALWYVQMQNWPDIPPFAPFLIGWLTAVAIKWGAGQKSSPRLRWMAVILTVLTFAVVLVLHLAGGDLAQFPQALQSWVEQDFSALLFLVLGLFYAYRTLTPRPKPRSPEQGAEAEDELSDAEGEAEDGDESAEEEAEEEEDTRLACARCQERIEPGEALIIPGAMRRSTVAVCPKCVSEIEARFTAETEDLQIVPAVLFGLGAAGIFGVAWYLLGRNTDSPLLNILALAAGWVIPEVVRYGAGKKRGRPLQLISLALTAALIIGANVALAWDHEGGLVAGLSARVSDFLTVVIFLLALWQAYSGPAPRKLVGMRQQPEEEEEEEEEAAVE